MLSRASTIGSEIQHLRVENDLLRARLETAERVLESATACAVITMGLDGRITGWSAGARAIFGHPAAEVLGQPGEMLLVPEDRDEDAFVRALDIALDHGLAVTARWHVRGDGTRFWASGTTTPLLDGEGAARGFVSVLHDGTEAQRDAERCAMRLAGLGRRARDALAAARDVAARTARHAGDLISFQASLDARLAALERSQDVLLACGRDGAPLREVIAGALAPHAGEPGQLVLDGPAVRLGSAVAVTLGLALHELAANAATHGALSVPGGRVKLAWASVQGARGRRGVELLWREVGGPPVRPPSRRGFGSALLEEGLVRELGGTARLLFTPAGVECRIALPLGPRLADGAD